MTRLSLNQALALALDHYRAGRLAEAEQFCRQVLDVAPDNVEALNLLAGVANRAGNVPAAVQIIQHALTLRPQRADLHANLGEALRRLGREDEAAVACEAALAREPNFPGACNTLGIILAHRGQYGEATKLFRRAIAHRWDFAEALNNLGNVLQAQLLVDDAIDAHRRALELVPSNLEFHMGLLSDLCYSESVQPDALLEAHREWWRRHGLLRATPAQPHANDRDPNRSLRVGLVSPDLRTHAVASFLELLLAAHDRSAIQFVAYAQVAQPDEVTHRLQPLFAAWRSTVALDDDALAAQIRADRIDILIDLAGHTMGNRLPVFSQRPAPVQMTWLGSAYTTGMDAIDYRITDFRADPPGMTEPHFAEKLLRLPRTAWCYRPPASAPVVEPSPPRESNGFITFGSFNNVTKLSPTTIATWAAVLRAVPDSRLMLKYKGMDDAIVRDRVCGRFAARGGASDRIVTRGHDASPGLHLAAYAEIDVALDPLHYCGTTTTCEALWMGVPVITLAGQTHASRVGVSLLSSAGLPELIAADRAAYVSIAAALAGDLARLRSLRSGLRQMLESSPLRDEAGFARDFDAVLRSAWQKWCVVATSV
ncbi:MAG: tetratricopeptide repeat protein [Tepidisphaeraceae bacterium]